MKLTLSLSTLLLALVSIDEAAAWGFYYGNQGFNGNGNADCISINVKKGTHFEWFRDPSEDCCVYLYANGRCSGTEAGSSCNDWAKDASRSLSNLAVRNC